MRVVLESRQWAWAACLAGGLAVGSWGSWAGAQTLEPAVPAASAAGNAAVPASGAAVPSAAPPAPTQIAPSGEGEEIMPISKADQALSLYRSVCLAALTDRVAFADKALARGLVPLHVAGMAGASAVPGEPLQDLLFTPGMESGMEVSIHLDQRCAVWIRGDSGNQLRKGFQRALQGMKRQGYPIQWVVDRTVPQKDGARQLLRAEAVLGEPAVRFRFDAALMAGDKRAGIQALTVQLDVVPPPEAAPSAPDAGASGPAVNASAPAESAVPAASAPAASTPLPGAAS